MVVKIFQPVDHQFESFSSDCAELENLKFDVFARRLDERNSEQRLDVVQVTFAMFRVQQIDFWEEEQKFATMFWLFDQR